MAQWYSSQLQIQSSWVQIPAVFVLRDQPLSDWHIDAITHGNEYFQTILMLFKNDKEMLQWSPCQNTYMRPMDRKHQKLFKVVDLYLWSTVKDAPKHGANITN